MRFLIISKNPRLTRYLSEGLHYYGHTVETSTDLTNPMKSRKPFRLIITTEHLNGVHLIDDIPILALIEDISDMRSFYDEGTTKCFKVHCPFEAIYDVVARMTGIRRQHVLTLNDLKIDTMTGEAMIFSDKDMHTDEIFLSRKEFDLLTFFARNKGVTLSKDRLIAHVWNYDADILPNTVEVYVKKLRERLDAQLAGDTILTIRGFGYRFEDAIV